MVPHCPVFAPLRPDNEPDRGRSGDRAMLTAMKQFLSFLRICCALPTDGKPGKAVPHRRQNEYWPTKKSSRMP